MPSIVVLCVALAACGTSSGGASGGGPGSASQDSYGDPYVTNAQGAAISVGQSAQDAFASLGGKASSGDNGQQAVPPLSYDYPIRGTGNADDPNDSRTMWWQICVKGGRVVGKARGTMDSLPGC